MLIVYKKECLIPGYKAGCAPQVYEIGLIFMKKLEFYQLRVEPPAPTPQPGPPL